MVWYIVTNWLCPEIKSTDFLLHLNANEDINISSGCLIFTKKGLNNWSVICFTQLYFFAFFINFFILFFKCVCVWSLGTVQNIYRLFLFQFNQNEDVIISGFPIIYRIASSNWSLIYLHNFVFPIFLSPLISYYVFMCVLSFVLPRN